MEMQKIAPNGKIAIDVGLVESEIVLEEVVPDGHQAV
jgi:hypothetical protein